MYVTKADGTTETFRNNKLRRSLRHAGAQKDEIDSIVREIEHNVLADGVTTQEIYRRAFELLRQSPKPIAAKYSLRRALFGMGPTGFPFEDFLAELFQLEGYKTKTRLTLRGRCATHEIDVAAYRPDHSFIAEAKFHMRPGIKTDLQVALYSYARLLDLREHPVCREDTCGVNDLLIVTNTKFTKAVIDYARCNNIELLSWTYPKGKSLQERIEKAKVYPVTALSTLSTRDKQQLLGASVVFCRDILKTPEILNKYGISRSKTQAVIEEARQLCVS